MGFMLCYSGQNYSQEELSQLTNASPFLQSIASFVKEWMSESDTIKVHTSGSTGTPKEISLLKSEMKASARLTNSFFSLSSGMKALLCLPVEFIAGKMMIVRAIEAGLELHLVTPDSNPSLHIDSSYHFAAMTPMQVHLALTSGNTQKIERIDQLIIGGGAVSHQLLKRIQTLTNRVFATYGMTETITHIAVQPLNNEPSQSFNALKGVSFSTDSRDCLVIKAQHLSNSPIVTNDIVQLTSPTSFKWLGRSDNIINSGGLKIIPEVVEEKLRAIVDIPFIVGSLPSEELGEKLILVLETEGKTDKFNNQIQSVLTRHEMPKEIFGLSHFPRTPTGKINRKEVLKVLSIH